MATDIELLDRWATGDHGAGNSLFGRHFDSICTFFETKVDGDVMDLVQMTFMACVQNVDSFRRESSFRTFLFSIARKTLYRYYRSKSRNRLDFNLTSVAELRTGARTNIVRAEDRQRLLQALCTLPLEQQILLELFYWENMESVELAEILDITPSGIRSRLYRARNALKERVAELSHHSIDSTMSVEDLDAWARGLRAQQGDPEKARP